MSPPRVITNRFSIADPDCDLLGRGGMGEVFRATDNLTGEQVAIKVLNSDILQQEPDLLARFIREGEALRRLNHPNILHMIAAVEDQGQHYLAMEYIEGGSLAEALTARGSLPAPEALGIALELADALTRAHHLGIIHRDLKPANVLLAQDGTPRLADFGVAHVLNSTPLTQTGVLIGTVDYLSPEICQGEPPSELSDLWAFGVMLFEMLSGTLPFDGKNLTAKITAILTQPVPDLTQRAPGTPAALVDLVYRMLEKEQRERIPSARLVAAELENILKGRSSVSTIRALPSATFHKGLTSGRPTFVGREPELEQLEKALANTLAGHGQVVFVTGDPGQGKTALTLEFGRLAQSRQSGLVLASGNCNADTGLGDPYLPFREIMGMLTGDVEALRDAGVIGQTQANRLRQAFTVVLPYLVESSNSLVDTLVPGAELVQRARAIPAWAGRETWLPQLEQVVARKAAQTGEMNLQPTGLFEQFTRLVRALGQQAPLLLLLDDLQWADSGSINLLMHLGKRLEGSRVMVVGAYRPTDVAMGRSGERHPLEAVINALKRQFGEMEVDLSKAEGRAFIDALLDTEPNQLEPSFREELFRFSGGHPLTTVELLRDMQERGGLIRDSAGCWRPGATLNWDVLPVRVEATIAERLGRLAKPELAILRVAAVQGETFATEVIARILGLGEPEVVACLSGTLDREHHLVSAQGIRQVGGQRISFYRFRHSLFQKYLYNGLDAVEQAHLHQQVGATLQALYGQDTEEIAVQLALHFQKAGTTLKAADYLSRAGDRASGLIAPQEAIDHFKEAMAAYEQALGDRWSPLERAALERKIGEARYKQGNHARAKKRFELAATYLGHALPTKPWRLRVALLREVIIQIKHHLLARHLTEPVHDDVDPRIIELFKSLMPLAWIEMNLDAERYVFLNFYGLNVAERCGYRTGIVGCLAGIGTILQILPLFRLAREYSTRAIEIGEQTCGPNETCWPQALAVAYMALGYLEGAEGNFELAFDNARKAADVSRSVENWREWGAGANLMVSALAHLSRYAEAKAVCENMLRSAQNNADRAVECWALSKKGLILWRTGQLPEAVQVLQSCRDLAEAIPSPGFQIAAEMDLSRTYVRIGDITRALHHIETARLLNLSTPQGFGMREGLSVATAEAYLALAENGPAHERATWLKKADMACQSAHRTSKSGIYIQPEALLLRGRYHWLVGHRAAALKDWQRSLALADKLQIKHMQGRGHFEMGRRLNDQAHLEAAQQLLTEVGAEWDLALVREALQRLA